jgi:acyl-CoA reductase-like NAD-dependent aldehyde dehydrogenase
MAVAVGGVGDKLLDLMPRVRSLKVGPDTPPHAEAEMGPLVTRQHLDKVRSYVDLGIQEGAKLVVDVAQRRRSFGGGQVGCQWTMRPSILERMHVWS